jgi:hypothetical protein
MKTPLTNKAVKLAEQISREYDKIYLDDYNFFDTYHDTMLYQKDGAWEIVNEVEEYERRGTDQYLGYTEDHIIELEKTLLFCKAVIKVQTLTAKLPEAIFG